MMEAMNPKEYLLSTLTKAGGEEDLIASPQNTIAVLQKYDFQFKKQFGQNFLVDLHVLGKILRAAEIGSEDVCLEIGPGIGSLTQLMGEAAKRVISVEIDNRLIPLLEENLAPWVSPGHKQQFHLAHSFPQEFRSIFKLGNSFITIDTNISRDQILCQAHESQVPIGAVPHL